jgi:uncharacterized protein YlzI (FlbEa/FlbD family)
MLELIVFQTLDGRDVSINPKHIVSISETSEDRAPNERLLTPKVHCVINLTNGTKVSVAEECDNVRQRLEQLK